MSQSPEPKPAKTRLRIREASAPGSERSKRTHGKKLEGLAKILIAGVVVGSPWFFGSVDAVAQMVIATVFMVCLVIWLTNYFSRSRVKWRAHSISILIFGFLVVGWIQQIHLPNVLASKVAGKQNEIRASLASGIQQVHPATADRILNDQRIVLNAPAGRYQQAYFVLVAVAFFLGNRFFHRRRDVTWLAAVLALNGVLIATFGAFQKVVNSNSVFGIPLEFGGHPFGSFVNRNNAAGYLLMCLGCGIAVLVSSFSKIRNRKTMQSKRGLVNNEALARFTKELRLLVANLNGWRIAMLFTCGLLVSGIALSLSRGGMISLLVAVVLLILFLFYFKNWRALILLVIFLVPLSVGSFVWATFQGDVTERLETLAEDDLLTTETRVKLWKDSLNAVGDYPLLGSGSGSFRYVYKEYQSFEDNSWHYSAENVFLEILITYGFIGFALVLGVCGFLLLAVVSLPQKMSGSKKTISQSTVIGILGFFVLVSQAIANFFDFGLLIPANGILFALLMGSIASISLANSRSLSLKRRKRFSLLPRWTNVVIPFLLCAGMGVSVFTLFQVFRTETANRLSRTNHPEEFSLDQVSQRITNIKSVIRSGDPSLESYEYLASLYVLRFQHELVELRMNSLPAGNRILRKTMWDLSSPRMLNLQFSRMDPEIQQRELEQLRSYEFYKNNLVPAVEAFENALVTCPLSVRSIVGLAEISRFTGHPVEPYFTTFRKFNVRRASWFRRMGDVAIAHQRQNAAMDFWKKALKVDPLEYRIILPTALEMIPDKSVCLELVPADAKILGDVAREYFPGSGEENERERLYQKVIEILSSQSYSDAENNYRLGKAYMEVGDINLAITGYKTATGLNPLNYRWKYELVNLYEMVGKIDEAKSLIRECAAAEPKDKAIQAKDRQLNGSQ